MKKAIITATLLFISFYGGRPAYGETILDPNIQGELHLGTDGSPYLASEEGLNVEEGGRLIIDPGVTILFPQYSHLSVGNGELNINGNSSAPVVLKGQDGIDWTGLSIDNGNVSINGLSIRNAYHPINSEGSTTTIRDLLLDGKENIQTQNTQYGIHSVNDQLAVSSSMISNFKTAGIFQESGQGLIEGNLITGNSIGIQYKTYSSPVLQRPLSQSVDYPMVGNQNVISSNGVNAKNLSDEAIIDLRDNYWGDIEGPKQTTIGNIVFNPWLNAPPMPISPACCSSILFIPGIEGSRLMKGTNQLWEPNRNADVKKLYMDDDGNSIDPDIKVGDIIKETNIGLGIFDKSIYKSFSNFLDGLVEGKTINQWQAAPYDWRMDMPVDDVMTKVEQLAQDSITGKVTIVAHSNGGLMAKKLDQELRERGKENLIDSIVLISTPQTGAPSSIGAILYGDEQSLAGGLVLTENNAKDFAYNMPGAYNLLPSKAELPDDLFNQKLLDQAKANHRSLDKWIPGSNIKFYQIGSYGLPTTSGINYDTHENIKSSDGDGTVPVGSAISLGAPSYAFNLGDYDKDENKNYSHADITEAPPIQELIRNLIESDVQNSPYISFDSQGRIPIEEKIIKRYAVHSPVSLDGYDKEGRHTGIGNASTTDIAFVEQNIPGTTYEGIGTDKYIYTASDEPIDFLLKGTSDGEFTFDGPNYSYANIPVEQGSIATVNNDSLSLDIDGDGTIDSRLDPGSNLTTLDYVNLFSISLRNILLPLSINKRLSTSTARLMNLAKKGRNEKLIQKIQNFYQNLETRKVSLKHAEDMAKIISIVGSTLDALENIR